MTTTIDTKAAKRFIHDLDNRIATASVANMTYLVKELQEIRNEASVLLGVDVPTELNKLIEKTTGQRTADAFYNGIKK